MKSGVWELQAQSSLEDALCDSILTIGRAVSLLP